MIASFDTNILLYAYQNADERRSLALRLVTSLLKRRAPIAKQVLREFLSVVHSKTLIAIPEAREVATRVARSGIIVEHSIGDLLAASRLVEDHNFRFYDALLCTLARREGVDIFLSEDMQDGRKIGAMTIVNPFVPANSSLIEGLLA